MDMFRHYFRIAIRSLAKQRVLSFINVLGLSLGLACFCLVLLFAVSEFSYDRWHEKAPRIYRVDEVYTRDDGKQSGEAGLYMPLGPALKKDFADVEEAVRVTAADANKLMKGNNGVMQMSMSFADPGFFSVFSFPLLEGNAETALSDPHAIVVTRSKAIQLFGTADAVGKTVQIKFDTTFRPFMVSAVAADLPVNTSITFDVMGSFNYLFLTDSDRVQGRNSWHMTFGDQTYVLLRPGSRLMNEPGRLLGFRQRYYPEEAGALHKGKGVTARFVLQPLTSLHTTSGIDVGPPGTTTDPKNIWILLSIAAAIVIIASINFTTMAIARSASRAREIGVRKVVGSLRRQLIAQFLTESVLLSVIATLFGLLLAYLLLPWFRQLSGRPLELSFSLLHQFGWILGGSTIVVGLLTGFYPALVLSGFNPVDVLRSRVRLGGSNYFTRGLVTFQFVLSIGLLTATVTILRQVGYMRSKDLGLIKENTIVVNLGNVDATKVYPLLRTALAGDRAVTGMATSAIGLGEGQGQMGGMYDFNGKMDGVIEYPVDADFIPVMGMRLLAGRNFDPSITTDTVGSVIVNETLVRNEFGLTPPEAVGKQFKTAARPGSLPVYKTIIGVARDFNFERLTRKVRPQLFEMPAQFDPAKVFVHLRAGNPTPTLARIREAWTRLAPDVPFNYSFLDEDLDRFYKSEARWGNIVAWAGGISIFLAALGLFGLAALAAANRIKEIGIRRVLGATPIEIVGLLTGGFLPLVLLAALIAAPLAWYFMHKWLQDFAYRIDIGWWTFIVTALAALGISYLTIGFQAWRAARTNPAKNLRVE
jgi:putative ABC transport system permease protein